MKIYAKARLLVVFFTVILSAGSLFAAPKAVVVLIPGLLNSLIPGSITNANGQIDVTNYFSHTIISSIAAKGYDVHVINHLLPFGQFEANGQIVYDDINAYYQANYPQGGVPIILIGHSCGGFYALHATQINQNLPIQKIVTVGTPLGGARLADLIMDATWGASHPDVVQAFSSLFDIRGLYELRTPDVAQFMSAVKIPAGIPVYAIAGYEPQPNMFELNDARYLCPACVIGDDLISDSQGSDGIVGVSSALGIGIQSPVTANLIRMTGFKCPLWHLEQPLDANFFLPFGIWNSGYIDQTQSQVYSAILDQI